MSKVYFYKEFGGFEEGFVPQNRKDLLNNPPQRRSMICYIDPDNPGGRAALTVKSMDNVINSINLSSYAHLRSIGLGVKHYLEEQRSPDGRYSARLEIDIGKYEHGFLKKKLGKVRLSSTKDGYKKEISCDPEIVRDVNDLVEELEAMANPDKILNQIALDGGF